jgi:uncharacterized repeat protein (TIGR03803 family)
VADAAGDLFGTTSGGGANHDGTLFEIAKSGSGYRMARQIATIRNKIASLTLLQRLQAMSNPVRR